MFAKTIIDSDAFLDMPLSTQALYFHLSMRADDDGFLNNPKKVQRMVGCSDDDLKILIGKNFLIPFESGVVVIKHWRIHNYIRSDRYKETVYKEEKSSLHIKDNGAYTLSSTTVANLMDDNDIPFGIPNDNQETYQMDTQVRLGKDSIGKDNINTRENNTKKKNIASLLDQYILHDEVKEALIDFIEMRKAKKRPLTERALKMVINKLRELSTDSKIQVDIINQSILHNWDTVYALKKDYYSYQQSQQTVTVNTESDPWKELDSFDDF